MAPMKPIALPQNGKIAIPVKSNASKLLHREVESGSILNQVYTNQYNSHILL